MKGDNDDRHPMGADLGLSLFRCRFCGYEGTVLDFAVIFENDKPTGETACARCDALDPFGDDDDGA